MSARRKSRTLPRPESAAQRFLALHRQFADECVDNIYRFMPNEPADTLGDLPAGLLVPIAARTVDLIPLPDLAASYPADEAPPSYAEEFSRASVVAMGEMLREIARTTSVNRVAIVYPVTVSDDIYTLREGPRAGQTTPGTSASVIVTVVTPAAHETWMATTIWMPETREAFTNLTPQPHDFVFNGETLTSFAAILA